MDQALQQHSFTIHKTAQEQYVVRDQQTAVRFPLDKVRPNGQPLVEQVQQAIERTLLEQQQEQRLLVARDPRSLKVTVTVVDSERVSERI